MTQTKEKEWKKVSEENLDILIEGLQSYKDKGVIDPWVLSDGERIEPLDILIELKECRFLLSSQKESWRKEMLERLEKMDNTLEMQEMDGIKYTEGFNQALESAIKIIKEL